MARSRPDQEVEVSEVRWTLMTDDARRERLLAVLFGRATPESGDKEVEDE